MRYRQAKYAIGQIVEHRHLGYHGVVIDVDYAYALDPQTFVEVNASLLEQGLPALDPDQPFYMLLTSETEDQLYVSEANLEEVMDDEAIQHEDLDLYFMGRQSGHYLPKHAFH